MPVSQRYAFGDFVLEPSQQRVRHLDGATLNLTPRLFAALQLFVENPGKLLDKDALMLALWPGLVVDENSLSQVVSGLRRALADDTVGSRYIQTVPRRGFRFVATVTVLPDSAVPVGALDTAGPSPINKAPGSREPERRHWMRLAWAGGAALGLGGVALWLSRGVPMTGAGGHALAVLPFKPLMPEGRDELLEVGMADSQIGRAHV